MRVEVKNNFEVSKIIEIVTPNGIIESRIEKIYKTKINHGIQKANTTFTESRSDTPYHKDEATISFRTSVYPQCSQCLLS